MEYLRGLQEQSDAGLIHMYIDKNHIRVDGTWNVKYPQKEEWS